ncbi:MAG: PIG-L family deacetylase [Herbiconiux sp.]|nr:PIG-L family deacetylase [Herbiconiux sp.]
MTLTPFGDAVVFAHAHPDDESISTGGTIAALLASGARVAVLTGTRGERGEVVVGEWSALEGTPQLGPHRVGELARALEALGGPAHAFLGAAEARTAGSPERSYSDSGMRWGAAGLAVPADDAEPDALSRAPLAEVTDDLLAGIRTLLGTPTAIVGYDAIGGYGHPDHVRMHEAGLAAAHALGVPYFAIVEPRVEARVEPRVDPDSSEIEVDLAHHGAIAAKAAAMAGHATQLTLDGARAAPDFILSGGQRHPVGLVERFRRLT